MSDSIETPPEPDSTPSAKKKGRWLDWLLVAVGLICVAGFVAQTIRYRRYKPGIPTGKIISDLAETERVPTGTGDAAGYNVLVITMDTTRADHIGCYGNQGVQTPVIDGMARSGVLCANAFTPSPSTLPGHSSIFTGLYPYNHGARANGTYNLGDDNVTLAEILKQEGYATSAVISAYVLDSRFGLNQGFDVFNDDLSKGVKHGDHTFRERPAEFTNEAAFAWLDANAGGNFFLWVHYFDPHAPYFPPEPFRTTYQNRLYDGEIAYVDQAIGALLAKLEELGVRDKTLVVLASDHGEGLGEHGENTHSMLVYDATLHTPLIFSCPRLFPSGYVLHAQASNVDIVPTVLDLLGVQSDHKFDGTSLLLPLGSRPPGLYAETISTLTLHGWSPLFCVRHADGKYIHAPTPEYYDLTEDPRELNNVLAENTEKAKLLSDELGKHIGGDPFGSDALKQAVNMDAETTRRMDALGYIGTTKPGDVDVEAAAKLDPKEMIHHWEAVQKATNLISVGKIHEGVEILEACVEEVPNDVWALRLLSNAYVTMGKYEEAEQMLRTAIGLETRDPTLHVTLGRALARKGQLEEAKKQYGIALQIDPKFAGTYVALAALAVAKNRREEAEEYFRKAIEMDPGTTGPGAYFEMGTMYLRALEFDKAQDAFESAIELDPLSGLAHGGLGSVFADQGKLEQALEEFAIAVRHEPANQQILASLAGLHDKLREFDKAKAFAERALDINPNHPSALNNLGLILKHTGELDQAMELFNRVLEAVPNMLACRINLAQCYLASNEEEKAAEQFRAVLRFNPRVPQALANLAVYHGNHGRTQQAIGLFERAIRADSDYAMAHNQLGVLLLQQGKTERALRHLRKSLELDPDQQGSEDLEHQVEVLEEALSSSPPTPDTAPEADKP